MSGASTSLTKGVSDGGDHDVLTVMTSFKRGCVRRLGNLADRILWQKLHLEKAVNSSVESTLWENSREDQEITASDKRHPPQTVEKIEYLHPNRELNEGLEQAVAN